jgi:hypothetical protein
VSSVIPDSVETPQPRPALAPAWRGVRRPGAPVIAGVVALAALAGGVAWRRRRPRGPAGAAPDEGRAAPGRVDDARWLAAGEPRAVAARAAATLRAALADAVPGVHAASSTAETLAAAGVALTAERLRELADVLAALDRIEFAAVHRAEVEGLAARAHAMTQELRP